MVGKTLGHYEILEPLGKGGMGEVYRARDTNLDRDVAIKVLPEDFATDHERLARFEREAKLLASLNHSNIATIHGLEESDGVRFIAMELVDGDTLADRLAASGRIEVQEALEIARQIAEALEAAHESGVIHRDLKPANVKVTPEEKVKVLDFGLAKAFEADGSPSEISPDLSHSPTMAAATRTGVILGTAACMSPEQARGKPVDRRTDIWAFGCVLYEMLTGTPAFAGPDIADIFAAVVRAEPDWDQLPEGLHPRVGDLLERCLEKELRNRYHDIADVRIDVDRILRDPHDARAESPGGTPRTSRRALAWGAAAFLLGAVLTGTTVWNMIPVAQPTPRPVRLSFGIPTISSKWANGLVGSRLAMSPDGTTVVYLGGSSEDPVQTPGESPPQLYLRRIDESEGRPIPGTEGAQNPFFSPDGAWIGFGAGGKLQRVPVAGGAPLYICNATNVFGASWGPDDSIIFGGGISSGLMRVAVAAGQPQPLTFPDPEKGEVHHGYPEILPDGRTVLFTIGTGDGSRIAKLSLETGEWEELLPSGAGARYLSAGYLVFSEAGNLRLVRFDAEAAEVKGSVFPALDGIKWRSVAGLEEASFAVSRTGDLAFVPGGLESFETNLVWVDRRGEETAIAADTARYIAPRISPSGDRIAVIRLGEFRIGEVWVMNLDGGQAFPVGDEGADYNPLWTTDGTTLTYTSNGDIFEKPIDRDGPRVRLLRRDGYQLPRSWSPDGRFLAFMELTPAGYSVWVMPRDGEPEPLVDSSFNTGAPRFSPRGGWIAYGSDESGQEEVYVRRYPGSDRGHRVSRGGGWGPVWSVDGQELFYRVGDRMMAVEVTTDPAFASGDPVELWEAPYFSQVSFGTNYDVASDGRFLMLGLPDSTDADSASINVFLDWLSGIGERMGATDGSQ